MIKWTFALLKTDGNMEALYSDGPMPLERIIEIIGGEPEFIKFADGSTAAIRKDPAGLVRNKHYPSLFGDVLLGKMDGKNFVGALGVNVIQPEMM